MRLGGSLVVLAQAARLSLRAAAILTVAALLLGASIAFAPRADASSGALASTMTTVTSSPNPSVYGQNVTFTIKVASASGTPTGKVTLLDNSYLNSPSDQFAILTLDANGQATISSARLFPGTHTMVAQYSGDTNFQASASATHDQVIAKTGTTTTLSSSLNPSVAGETVSYSITVTAAGSESPTGTVVVKDRSTPVGTPAALGPGGKATIRDASLSVGTHLMTATFTPDLASNKFVSSSTSAILTQVVTHVATPVTSTAGNNAYVRIVQSSMGYETYDISIDGKLMFPNMEACSITQAYFPIVAGNHTFTVAAPGGATLLTKSLTLSAGAYYTLALVDKGARTRAPSLLTFTDDNTVTPDQANVRVYDLADPLGVVRVLVGSTIIASNLAPNSATGYTTQRVGTVVYSFQPSAGVAVTDASVTRPVISDLLDISANQVYSIFLICRGYPIHVAVAGALIPPHASVSPTSPVISFSSSAFTPPSAELLVIVGLLALLVGAAGGYALSQRRRMTR